MRLFSAPAADRALTVFTSYSQRNVKFQARNRNDSFDIDAKLGPWASLSTLFYLLEIDATDPYRSLKSQVAKIVGDATSETEKARRIHRYVAETYQRFLKVNRRTVPTIFNSAPLDAVLNFQDYSTYPITWKDFLWLDLALDRAAGLETQAILLPNRRLMRFNPQYYSEVFMPTAAARVRVDGSWQYSMPMTTDDLPFGRLAWPFEGSMGLIAQTNKVEFITIPPAPAAVTTTETKGEFILGIDGSLSGHAERRITGHRAIILRSELRKLSPQERRDAIDRSLKTEFSAATAVAGDVGGVDDVDAPLAYGFDLTWDDYAVSTKKRMIFRPSVLHGTAVSPFSAETRHNLVDFPYHWRDIDDLSLQLPTGYQLEAPSAPRSFPRKDLNYQVDLTYAADTRQLHLRRDFSSELSYVQPSNYTALRGLYANVARGDAHELILVKSDPAASPAPDAPAPSPDPAPSSP